MPLAGQRAAAVSLPIAPPRLTIASYRFELPTPWHDRAPPSPLAAESGLRSKPGDGAGDVLVPPLPKPATHTRIKPPADVVKLEDRLFYLLQPSLEALVGDGALVFPAQPFDYQFQGVAFLYPRFAAILADEMGLGKTMQAITAIRLLLHTG
jgi:hypothetical protein